MTNRSLDPSDLERIREHFWYHTIDVAPDVATPGWFDNRRALQVTPFPDVRGKRCLDVGTWDGLYAFEMERRGAAEVVAIDLPDITQLDFPAAVRADPGFDPRAIESRPRRAGFDLLAEILESKVRWMSGSIYDLDPDIHGRFDVVIVGSLLVHLQNPVKALEAVRTVTSGHLVSIDYIHPTLELLSANRRPIFQLRGEGVDFQWWLASDAGLRQAIRVAGFEIERSSERFVLRYGERHDAPSTSTTVKFVRSVLNGVLARGDAGAPGHLHRAHVARPLFD